jgi:Sulfotransferase family
LPPRLSVAKRSAPVIAGRGVEFALENLRLGHSELDTEQDRIDRRSARADHQGDENAQRSLNYAAAKTFLDLEDADHAFAHLTAAKSSRRIDRNREEARLKRLRSLYNPVFLKAREKLGVRDRTPIFIVGMPRSGTSLTEQIISNHPQVFGAGELSYLHQVANQLLYSMPTLDVYAGKVAGLTDRGAHELAGYYLAKVRGLSADAPRITDKMPHNFLHVGLIALLLPEARIIHCRRAPLDTCFSIYTNNFNERHPYAHDLSDLGWYYRQYEGLMAHWRTVVPDLLLDVQYEELVEDLEGQTRRILEFLGLPFDEACLDFQANRRSVATISRVQVRQPLYRTSMERWRPYEKHLGPLVEALGGL